MRPPLDSTPRADGFRMPGEHEPQQAVVMAWPERLDNWRDNAAPAREAFAMVANTIAEETPVIMCARSSQLAIDRDMM